MQKRINEVEPVGHLTSRTIKALLWSFVGRFGGQAVHLIIAVILARLLVPADFGLIGMLSVFVSLAGAFSDSGFGAALIQKQDADRIDESTVFYFNIVVGIGAAGVLCGAAPWIARFYRAPLLVPLTRLLSITIVINSFGLVQSTLLRKKMNFYTPMLLSLMSAAMSGGLGIILAVRGWSVWSLVWQSISYAGLYTCMLWAVCGWRPSRTFRTDRLKTLASFGSKLLFSGLLGTFFQNIYTVVIGRVFSASDLGYYSRARSLEIQFETASSGPLSAVLFPALCGLQSDRARLKRAYRRSLNISMFINAPLMLGLAAAAEPVIVLLFSERWLPSVPYFRLLCIAGVLYPLHVLNLNLLKVMGRSDLFLGIEILKKILVVLSIAVTYRWGIGALLLGRIATSLLAYGVNSYFSAGLIGYGAKEQLADVVPVVGIAGAISASMVIIGSTLGLPPFSSLLVQAFSGAALYVGLSILTGSRGMACVFDIAKPLGLSLLRLRGIAR